MRQKIRVLQIQSKYNVDDSDLAEQIILALPSDEYEVTSAYLKGRPGVGDTLTRAPHAKYFEFNNRDVSGRRSKVFSEIKNFCNENNFDIVIAHRFKPIHVAMRLNRELAFKCCIGVSHGIGDYDRSYRKLFVWRSIRENWKMVAVSDTVRTYLTSKIPGLTKKNTITINNAIDISAAESRFLSQKEARRYLTIPENAFVFGAIGRLVPIKNHLVMLKALLLLKGESALLYVVIIGGGRCLEELRAFIDDNNLEDNVILAGEIPDAYRFARAFDVFVMPSLSEGLPIALLEAMAASCPVIGSDIPSIGPLIEQVGRTFKVDNSQELAKQMSYFFELEPECLREIGLAHLEHVKKHHNILKFRSAYHELIKSSVF
ncbi:MAG: glycosyltransferase [Porticoccaceae bacterium]